MFHLGGVQSKSVDQYDLEKDEWKEGEIFIFKSFHVILFSFGPPIYPISIRKRL